jgi:hypothetical protein
MPLVAPVITATLPLSRPISCILPGYDSQSIVMVLR